MKLKKIAILNLLIVPLMLAVGTTTILSMERVKFKTTKTIKDLRDVIQRYRNNQATALNVLDVYYKIIHEQDRAKAELNRLGISLDQLRKEARRAYLAKRQPSPAPKLTPKKSPTPKKPKTTPTPRVPQPRAIPRRPAAPIIDRPISPTARISDQPDDSDYEVATDRTAPSLRRLPRVEAEEISDIPSAPSLRPRGREAEPAVVDQSESPRTKPSILPAVIEEKPEAQPEIKEVPSETPSVDEPRADAPDVIPGPEAPAAQQQPEEEVRVRFQIPEHTPILEIEDRGYVIGQNPFIEAVTGWDGRVINQVAQALNRAANNDVLRLQVLGELLRSMSGDIHPFTRRKIKLLAQPLINSYQNQNDDEFTNLRKIIRNI